MPEPLLSDMYMHHAELMAELLRSALTYAKNTADLKLTEEVWTHFPPNFRVCTLPAEEAYQVEISNVEFLASYQHPNTSHHCQLMVDQAIKIAGDHNTIVLHTIFPSWGKISFKITLM